MNDGLDPFDRASLIAAHEYLRDPKAKIKGTKMVFPGLKKDEEIVNVIAYLKQHPK